MKKTTKLGMSALLISLFALFVGKKLDDEVNKDAKIKIVALVH